MEVEGFPVWKKSPLIPAKAMEVEGFSENRLVAEDVDAYRSRKLQHSSLVARNGVVDFILYNSFPRKCKLSSSCCYRHVQDVEKLPFRCQKRKQYTPRVLAYYGLQKPPYKLDALEPYMSQRTLEVHWGEHHRGYLEGPNNLQRATNCMGTLWMNLSK
ncbi:hypothetical protein Vadar_018991 [Vaccinium darrowii]|uniref:Uncharacterized protein n=1 Tax=Vaccinium darrowii TaxID=229202 RepID=A0ACB7YFN3_9ERIC|nr:hypothetical protein Vadar_018991 [Vaccinium darrowii]